MQLYFLDLKGEPCFEDSLEAWDLGPVVPVAYFAYRSNGANEILSIPTESMQSFPIEQKDQEIIECLNVDM